jgi:hypothetical protein
MAGSATSSESGAGRSLAEIAEIAEAGILSIQNSPSAITAISAREIFFLLSVCDGDSSAGHSREMGTFLISSASSGKRRP